jgi:secondary thiamine-phosphate synthase enzyme
MPARTAASVPPSVAVDKLPRFDDYSTDGLNRPSHARGSRAMKTLTVRTRSRCQMVDVTGEIQRVVREAGLTGGQVICYVPHTTAGITIQENADPDVVRDMLWKLEQLVPRDEGAYQHSEGNSDSHIKASLIGASESVLVEDGRLVLGTWQGIYFCEFDGPRSRKLHVKCLAG